MSRPDTVALVRATRDAYTDPEIARRALRELAQTLGWGASADGVSPFAELVPSGARVVVKPNWVLHQNRGPWGIEPLVTQSMLIRTVAEALLGTAASQVTVGDAPLQECNFEALLAANGCITQLHDI